MNVQKLGNNHYRVRQMYNGKLFSKYYPYKPTQREASDDMNKLIQDYKEETNIDKVEKCITMYLESKKNILSPSTIRRYHHYIKSIPDSFAKMSMSDIDKIKLQALVNDYSLTHNPKTTKGFYGFISSVISAYTDKHFKIVLPQIVKPRDYIPTKEDIKNIIDKAKGTRYDIPILLASYGLRIGEIMALELDDVKNGKIIVSKTVIYDTNYNKLVKPPKTLESNRVVNVPLFITDLIKQRQEIYNGTNGSINKFLNKVQKELGIPKFSVHKLRHFFATELHNRNIPSKYIQAMGGWATDNIMKSVYTHTNKNYETINLFD